MQILLDTQLMPQYLPGAPASAGYQQVRMVPADNGQPLLFTLDHEQRLLVWLPGAEGYTRWVQVSPTLMGVDNPRILDLDLISNHGQGRGDNTLDLLLLADVGAVGAPDVKAFYWPGMPASADPEAWRLGFAACAPLVSSFEQPTCARLGLLPLPVRSVFLVRHLPASTAQAIRSRFDAQGRCIETAPLPFGAAEAFAHQLSVAAFVAARPLGDDEDALIAAASMFDSGAPGQVSVQLPASDGQPPWSLALQSPLGSSAHWISPVNVNTFTRNDTGEPLAVFNLPHAGQLSQTNFAMTPALMRRNDMLWSLGSSLPGWSVAPGAGQALRLDLAAPADPWRWFALVRPASDPAAPASLQMTLSAQCLDPNVASTLVTADVAAYSVCQCTEAETGLSVLHILVAYEEGGLEIFSQDSISAQWQRHTVTDDNLQRGLHTRTSYTTRIRVLDDTSAPVLNAAVRLRPHAPCFGLLNGQAAHLSPLAPTVASTTSGGEITFIQPVSSLGAVQIDVEVVQTPDGAPLPPGLVPAGAQRNALLGSAAAHSVSLNPMAGMTAQLGAVTSGLVLQQAQASDGSHPFAHLPLDTCNQAVAAMTPFLQAYHATLAALPGRRGSAEVVRRTQLCWQGGVLTTQELALDAPPQAPQDGVWDAIGDIMGFLWTAVSQALDDVTVTLNWLADGLCSIAVKIGAVVWNGLVAIASQAAELLDWTLQKTLGVKLGDIVNWLGHVFNWDEIVQAHNALRKLALLVKDQTSDWMRHQAPQELNKNLQWARALMTRLPDLDPETRTLLARRASQGDSNTDTGTAGWSGPDARWGAQTFQSYSGNMSLTDSGAWSNADAIEKLVSQAGASLQSTADDIAATVNRPGFTDLPLLTVFEDLIALVGSGTLDLLQPLVQQLLGLLANMVDDAWDAFDQPLDIPVITPLYETLIAPGSRLSLLDAVLLSAACLGNVGSRLALDKPLISSAFREAIEKAGSLQELLLAPRLGNNDNASWATDVLLLVTLFSGVCKLLYFMAWTSLRYAGAGSTFDHNLVRSKCILDSLAWMGAMGWASARCASVQPSQDALKGTVVFLLVDGVVSRGKDAMEMAYATGNGPPPAPARKAMAIFETCLGALLLLGSSIYTSVKVTEIPRTEPSDPANWALLQTTPLIQSFGTTVYMGMAWPDSVAPPTSPLGVVRAVTNGVRSTVPLVSMAALAVAAKNDWHVPGTIAN